MSVLNCYYGNTVLRFVWYRLVFYNLVWKLIFIYDALTHSYEQQHGLIWDFHRRGWVYYDDTNGIRFKDFVKWFGFYLTNYKVYIHLPCINTQKLTTAPLNITHIISSSNHWSTILSQGRPSIVREIITLILFLCFIHLRQFTTVTNQCQQLSQTWTYLFEVLIFLISFE